MVSKRVSARFYPIWQRRARNLASGSDICAQQKSPRVHNVERGSYSNNFPKSPALYIPIHLVKDINITYTGPRISENVTVLDAWKECVLERMHERARAFYYLFHCFEIPRANDRPRLKTMRREDSEEKKHGLQQTREKKRKNFFFSFFSKTRDPKFQRGALLSL